MADNTQAEASPRTNRGPIITALVSLVAIGAIGATFMANASPYVDVDGALHNSGSNLHLAGKIIKTSIHADYSARKINFTVEDAKGKQLPVEYSGEAISNIDEADRVVAIGGMDHGVFHSGKLLIKCPSKYGDNKAGEENGSYKSGPKADDGQKGI